MDLFFHFRINDDKLFFSSHILYRFQSVILKMIFIKDYRLSRSDQNGLSIDQIIAQSYGKIPSRDFDTFSQGSFCSMI